MYKPAKPKGLFAYKLLSMKNTVSVYYQIHLTCMYSLYVVGGPSSWLTQEFFQKPWLISSDEDADI